nr:Tn3 family transposase [Streptomyces sp. SID8352]
MRRGQVRAYELLRISGREGRPTPLGAASAEYGRIGRTMHLLALVDPVDDTCRRPTGNWPSRSPATARPTRPRRHLLRARTQAGGVTGDHTPVLPPDKGGAENVG